MATHTFLESRSKATKGNEMKGIAFRDKDGNLLGLAWNADPLNYPPSKDFPEGWTHEEMTQEEAAKLFPDGGKGKRLSDPPHDQIAKLKEDHDLLIEYLEDAFKLKRGDLRNMLDNAKEGIR